MRIIGIDPGYAIIGYGVLDYDGTGSFHVAAYGAITTEPNVAFELRLKKIYEEDFTSVDNLIKDMTKRHKNTWSKFVVKYGIHL